MPTTVFCYRETESIKPSKLRKHFKPKHSNYKDMSVILIISVYNKQFCFLVESIANPCLKENQLRITSLILFPPPSPLLFVELQKRVTNSHAQQSKHSALGGGDSYHHGNQRRLSVKKQRCISLWQYSHASVAMAILPNNF